MICMIGMICMICLIGPFCMIYQYMICMTYMSRLHHLYGSCLLALAVPRTPGAVSVRGSGVRRPAVLLPTRDLHNLRGLYQGGD